MTEEHPKKPKKRKRAEGPTQAKKAKFVKALVATDHVTKAATIAGYAPSTAAASGSRLLAMPDVKAAVAAERAKIFEKLDITAERVMAELAALAFSNPKQSSRWNDSGVELKDSDDLSDQAAAGIKKVSYRFSDGGGHVSLEMHDKRPALETLAKMMGLQEPDPQAVQQTMVVINLGGGDAGTN